MGKNNRQRRAAKRRRQGRATPPRSAWSREQSSSSPFDADPGLGLSPHDVFMAAVHAHHQGDDDVAVALSETLAAQPGSAVVGVVQRILERDVAAVWDDGWQPADVARVVRRRLSTAELRVLECCVAAGANHYESLGETIAPEWMGQLEAMGATRWWKPGSPYLDQLGPHRLGRADAISASVKLANLLLSLPTIPALVPPPSAWRPGMAGARVSGLAPGVLDKVRALLAKAESTTFEAEAEAFTAKAQELMTRHRIDRAVLAAGTSTAPEEPVGRRLGIDDPYAEAKAVLLDNVCAANGGHSVWSRDLGFSTVFAFSDDLDAIDGLFTSLLVQATAALQREGAKHDRFGRSRTTRFRRSFLLAFAVRVGHRLSEAAAAATADAQAVHEVSLLPVLAARDHAVDDTVARMFPDLTQHRPTATDGEGWHAGTLFGDMADLGLGAPVEAGAAS